MSTVFNSNDIRINNTKRIIYALRNSPPLTKKDLAESLGLSLPTIASIAADLEEKGFLIDCGRTDSSVGRKPSLIALNREACYAIGIHISTHSCDLAIVSFGGDVVSRREKAKAFTGTGDYWEDLSGEIRSMIEESGLSEEKIEGIRIALPYILFPEYWSRVDSKAKPDDMVLPKDIPQYFSYDTDLIPVAIAAGVPRYWYGKLDRDAAVIFLSRYIEGCLLKQDPYTGSVSAQPCLIGHMSLNYRGRDCFCGKKGCFQEYCSTSLIVDRINGIDTSHEVVGYIPENKLIGWEDFFKELENGNRQYADLWDRYLERLAYAVDNIRLMTSSDIIICGDISEYIARFKSALVEKIRAISIYPDDIEEALHTSGLSRYDACIGAALSRIDSLVEKMEEG